jgi:hypothetical protein
VQPAGTELWGSTYPSNSLQRLFNFPEGLAAGLYELVGSRPSFRSEPNRQGRWVGGSGLYCGGT